MADRSASEIVEEFCGAWGRGDLAAIIGAFTDDAVYHNIPMDPLVGKEAIEGFISGFLGSAKIGFEIHHQVESADGAVVMNERTDTIDMGDNPIELPVMGTFVLRDGRIAEWRDYFDMAQFAGS